MFVHGSAALAEAKKLVRDVGSPKQSMTLLTKADDVASTQIATLVQADATSIGLNMKIVRARAATTIAMSFNPKQAGKYDIIVDTSGYSDVPDPLELSVLIFHSHGSFNLNGYTNPRVDQLLDQARSTLDPTARAKLINPARS